MKAKIKPRIELENRTRLEEVIPLAVPFTVFIDPSDRCNFACKFCPTGSSELMTKFGRPLKVMDFDLYKKVIDDLTELPHPIKVLRLYKDGEPLLNPRFPDMIRYGKEKGVAHHIDTTTNASALTRKKGEELIAAGLNRINISIYGVNDQHYQDFSNAKVRYEKIVENVAYFHEISGDCEVCVKICGDVITEEEKHQFIRDFGDICDRIFIEHIAPCWPDFEMEEVSPNQEFGIYGQKIERVEVCPYIFYSLAVNSDGTCSLCFLDWSRELVIGDLKRESFLDIWNGQKLRDYRIWHLQKKRSEIPVCKDCGQLTHCLPDNIDPYADLLLERLLKEQAEHGASTLASKLKGKESPSSLRILEGSHQHKNE